ncbi:hypothetical protein [Allopusillimonas ginsengisoli]|uniref:hypothetical protein n=1 Tax=Allopusillimonas ginsengisoli TaxID=453575 RepID=UPI001020259D|nr:hypothetical protein [Allopusillimonas ginsengisoli]TEA79800.1 hypothetical protein ERE07_02340 [Allopusillimonas ginsengisoli]
MTQDTQRAALETQIELPPLPLTTGYEPDCPYPDWVNDLLQDYARAAIEHDRKGRGEPVAAWLRVSGDSIIASRSNWLYPHATEDDAGPRDEQRYAAVGRRDGDILLNTFIGSLDLKDLETMLSWPAAPQPAEPVKVPSDDDLFAIHDEYFPVMFAGHENYLRFARDLLSRYGSATQLAAYKDSTPGLRVGDSSFEAWFSGYNPAGNGDKQRARDAYAAGMGDPLVTYAQPAASAEPSGEVRVHDNGEPTYLDGIECQYSIVKGEPWPNCEPLAYVFDRNIAERIAAALNAAPVAAQQSVPDKKTNLHPLGSTDHFARGIYIAGWNDCRAAMLEATPTPPATGQAQQERNDKVDAERYRWWREYYFNDAFRPQFVPGSANTPEELDAGLDAARAQQEGES